MNRGERRQDIIASGDLEIDVQASAREVEVRVAPHRIAIEQWGAPGSEQMREGDREGLPETVRSGGRYRDVLVRFRLATRLLPRPAPEDQSRRTC